MTNAVIGTLTIEIIKLLSLPHTADVPIFIGQGNIAHMQNKRPDDYAKYGHDIALILECPDYVGINIKDSSIEYVKEYIIDEEYVKVAVRVSSNQGKRINKSQRKLRITRIFLPIFANKLNSIKH